MSAVINRDPVALILNHLEGVRKSGAGWIAKCPAHEDRSPSLSVKEGQRGVMLRCFAGCSFVAITEALGLRQSIFSTSHYQPLKSSNEPLRRS